MLNNHQIAAVFRVLTLLLLTILALSVGAEDSPLKPSAESTVVGESGPPNIVFILADDLGYTDLGSYGSEISTPNLDALAETGLRFTNYHTAANCAPSRAMLLTGVSSHLAGVPNIPEMLAPEQRAAWNYQGVLGNDVVTVATLLEDAGYHTYMAGKWHLGMEPEKRPIARGFQRTVAMMDSGADNWEQRPYLPLYDQANWFEDGERIALPDDFYSSRYLVDRMIEFIGGNAGDQKPFFAYLPFMAVHIPVQAPQRFTDNYLETYIGGWDELRQQRLQSASAKGIVPQGTPMVTMSTTGDWQSLSEERRRYEAKRMAVYAGMIEAMDFHIGRLIDYLKASGQYDNTVFIFTSDNGSEASGSVDPTRRSQSMAFRRIGYNADYETLGLKGSYNTISPSFASASASPLSYFKFYSGEGGMRVPLIISGAATRYDGGLTPAFAWATDITPTILSLAGVEQPGERYAGRAVHQISGKDLSPLLSGQVERIYTDTDSVGYELAGHGALFQGDYKLTLIQPPLGDGQWRLYNIVSDPGETLDLAAKEPARFQTMLSAYTRFQRENAVLPMPEGFTNMKQLVANTLRVMIGDSLLIGLLTVLLITPCYVAYRAKQK